MKLVINLLCVCALSVVWLESQPAIASPTPTADEGGSCPCENIGEMVNEGVSRLEIKQEEYYLVLRQKLERKISTSYKDYSETLHGQVEALARNYSAPVEELRSQLEELRRTQAIILLLLEEHIHQKPSQQRESVKSQSAEKERGLQPTPIAATKATANTTDIVSVSMPQADTPGGMLDIASTFSLKGSFEHPVNSCKYIPEGSPSGDYYVLNNCNKTPVKVYCDMTRSWLNSTSGWARVANLDMTNSSHECPGELNTLTRSSDPQRLCGSVRTGFSSVRFDTYGITYSKICGRIKGYHFGQPWAFYSHSQGLESYYMDGISLTYGGPGARKHIWTFAAGSDETNAASWKCPCTRTDLTWGGTVPSFVGQDYFCDTANHDRSEVNSVEFYDDPLWDGDGCSSTSTCCCFNNPPWFCKELPESTAYNIELRLCNSQYIGNSDTPIEMVELYIQ